MISSLQADAFRGDCLQLILTSAKLRQNGFSDGVDRDGVAALRSSI
ncbi:hypothetical protein ACE4RR_13800 [Alteribacillus sp. HJP-4]